MSEEAIYVLCISSMTIPVLYIIVFAIKYYYISAVCREWNEKLYSYTKHIEKKKDWKRENYKYLEDMYLYPDDIGIYVFKDWKESDLIFDKFTLFNVNEHNRRRSAKKKLNNEKA
jgi:hypothetical protein